MRLAQNMLPPECLHLMGRLTGSGAAPAPRCPIMRVRETFTYSDTGPQVSEGGNLLIHTCKILQVFTLTILLSNVLIVNDDEGRILGIEAPLAYHWSSATA